VYRKRVKGCDLTFWMDANSSAHAKRMAEKLADDMKSSLRLRRAWEIVPGHVGVGHAGIAKARRKGKR
jgi:hypothetical protein